MGFTGGRIVFNQSNGVYHPGQTIFGKVIFDERNVKTCRGIYVVIQGFCKVRWTKYRSRGFDDVYESYEEYIHKKLYLVGGDGQKTTLVPGHYEFPFECALPANLPSSFEGTVGHIRYGLKVVVDRAFKFDQELVSPLTIISLMDLNMIPPARKLFELEMEDVYCCWCVISGTSKVQVKMPSTGFCVGSTTPMQVSCTNSSSVKIKRIRICIIKNTTYIATSDPGERMKSEKLLELATGPVQAGTTSNWMFQIQLPHMDVYNLNRCRFIDIDYYFKVTAEVSGCHINSEEKRKIFIGNVPLRGITNPMENIQNIPSTGGPSTSSAATNQPMPYPGVARPTTQNQPLPQQSNYDAYPGGNPPPQGIHKPMFDPPPYPGINNSLAGSSPSHPNKIDNK